MLHNGIQWSHEQHQHKLELLHKDFDWRQKKLQNLTLVTLHYSMMMNIFHS